MKVMEVKSTDHYCSCGGKLERETTLIFDNYVQMYAKCLDCKGNWTFENYLTKEAISFYQD